MAIQDFPLGRQNNAANEKHSFVIALTKHDITQRLRQGSGKRVARKIIHNIFPEKIQHFGKF